MNEIYPEGGIRRNKTVVITGGAAGFIERQFYSAVVDDGGTIVVAAIVLDAATRMVLVISDKYPGWAEAVSQDITSRESGMGGNTVASVPW